MTGMAYSPWNRSWDVSRDMDVNYMVVARRLMQMA
jgi:2-polyprenyl-3-methyl-5-hydroxy-6-metoxy-1,4-benzoquinol methylase